MRPIEISACALAMLTACASADPEPIDPAGFIAATPIEAPDPDDPGLPARIVETPVPLPLPGQMKAIGVAASLSSENGTVRPASTATGSTAKSSSAPASTATGPATPIEAIAEGREGALIEPSVDGFVNAIQVYPYMEGALYRLYGSPGQISDIALQPGEALVSVSAGDTVRWVLGDTLSGAGEAARAHVLVKPVAPDIRTNLMIATDRRTYHLDLVSTGEGYMAALSWRYPADALATMVAQNERARAREAGTITRGLALDALDFDYRLSGDSPDWKPVRVFDDGRQVFIQMPRDIAASDMPPLFVLGSDGEAELVNYRVRGRYYVVDRLFTAAELRLGEKDQTVVRISRPARQSALAALFGG
ncbi:P-type conjugative transfer protein TrbG [Aquisalinus luteolus]|nr:P-type conjugative transfer protein TrbG [Aquisalinus luteolus]GGH94413.1 P-type conjugative transfer protein TrbG [Aquisalinus luteolus]